MLSLRQSIVHRRSFLVAAASLIGASSFVRLSQGAALDATRAVHPHRDADTTPSGENSAQAIDLKTIDATRQLSSVRLSDGTYRLTMASGSTASFAEFNLHFKIDSSARGPNKGKPVLVPSGMKHDRAYVVFSNPRELDVFFS